MICKECQMLKIAGSIFTETERQKEERWKHRDDCKVMRMRNNSAKNSHRSNQSLKANLFPSWVSNCRLEKHVCLKNLQLMKSWKVKNIRPFQPYCVFLTPGLSLL